MVAVEVSKVIVVVINLIFLLFGLACLIVGIVFKVGWDDVKDAFVNAASEVDVDLKTAGDVLGYAGIIFGSFIIIVSLLGCIGACCKLRLLLVLYAIILLILLIGEVAIVALVATHVDKTKDEIGKALEDRLYRYREDSGDDKSKAFSAVFNKLGCCGVYNYSKSFPYNSSTSGFDTAKERPGTLSLAVIPITCCRGFDYTAALSATSFDDHASCLQHPNASNAYTEGCLPTVIDTITDNKTILIGVGVAILALELIMIFIAFFLCCRYDKD